MTRLRKIDKDTQISLPHKWTPRNYQFPIWDEIVNKGTSRAVCVWHRRAGKDKSFINILAAMASKRKGTYYYFLPTYNQGKKIIWDGMDKSGMKFLDHFPEEIVVRRNDTEMKLELVNGSIFQVVGTDNYNSIMGTNPIGCVFSEYSLQDPKAWEFIRPILLENEGWAIFNFTPRGNNHAKKLYDEARGNDKWFVQLLTVEDTLDENGNRYITDEMIESERVSGMSDRLIEQEYYCKFVDSEKEMLIPSDLIRESMYRSIEYEHGKRVAGLDCARKGRDNNAIVVRCGGRVTYIDIWSTANVNNPTIFTSSKVLDLFEKRVFDVVCVDSIGYGGGVADYLRNKSRFPVYDVNVAESSSDNQRFSRLRDEAWWKVREWFYARKCSIPPIKNRQLLIDDLTEIYFEYMKGSEKIKISSKDDLYAIINRSPDVGDALMHTFAVPTDEMSFGSVDSKVMYQGYADSEYNPFVRRATA